MQPDGNKFDFTGERMTRKEAAAYLGLSPTVLAKDITYKKHGIPYIKLTRHVVYLKSDLDAWIFKKRVAD